jgi:excisionase family DNA binding protein
VSNDLNITIPDRLIDLLAQRVAQRLTDQLTHPNQPEPTPWLNVEQAGEYLACPPSRIYDLTAQGRLTVHKEGGRSLYRRADLDACVREPSS